jgi:hypothetical protein
MFLFRKVGYTSYDVPSELFYTSSSEPGERVFREARVRVFWGRGEVGGSDYVRKYIFKTNFS